MKPVFLLSDPTCDICGKKMSAGESAYDAKTRRGPWANMDQKCFDLYGLGRLGTGLGQRYTKQLEGPHAGRWMKVEG